MSCINSEIITGIALIFLSVLFVYAGSVNTEWARIIIADYIIAALGGGFLVLGIRTLRSNRKVALIKPDLSKQVVTNDTTMTLRKLVFGFAFIPFLILILLLLGQWLYYFSLSHNVSTDYTRHISEVRTIVLRYQDQFTPTQVNSTKHGEIPAEVATIAGDILAKISFQFLISLLSCIMIGVGWTIFRLSLIQNNQSATYEKPKRWVDSGSSGSSAITASVSIGLTIVGAVSLLSPGIVGGYILAGLETLLVCVIVGILVQFMSGGVETTKKLDNSNNVELNRDAARIWDTLISVQFVLPLLGIGLIVAQIFSLVR